jgi:cytochrome c-type biogenesis protein CcmE
MKTNSEDRVVELKNKKITFFSIIVIVVILLLYFGFQAFSEATYKYYSVSEIHSSNTINNPTKIGLKAVLVENTYVRSADGLSANFKVKDKDNISNNQINLNVEYSGEIGSVFFNEFSELIMIGNFDENGTFIATNLSVRCPSKYMTEEDLAS